MRGNYKIVGKKSYSSEQRRHVRGLIKEFLKEGMNDREVARKLVEKGIKTPNGKDPDYHFVVNQRRFIANSMKRVPMWLQTPRKRERHQKLAAKKKEFVENEETIEQFLTKDYGVRPLTTLATPPAESTDGTVRAILKDPRISDTKARHMLRAYFGLSI